jgi:GntR family transcriptional regulator, transcriptional repressor for pyruvate dehydrogenase complex
LATSPKGLISANGAPRRVRAVRVAETVASELRTRILSGEFPDGRLPKQDDLREEYGISYPSLREALRILETEGLVTVRRGNVGGAAAHPPDRGHNAYALGLSLQASGAGVRELASAVANLEPICSRLCAERSDRRKFLPELYSLIERTAVRKEVEFTDKSREFHMAIVENCGNRPTMMLVGSLVTLWTAQEEVWASSLSAGGEYPDARRRRDSVNAHRKLLTAIEGGDGATAERVARSHLLATQKYFFSRVDDHTLDATSSAALRVLRS